MAKGRKSGRMRKAYLKPYNADLIKGRPRGPDQRFPQGVKVGGSYLIFPASPKSRRISEHSALTEVPPTQTHGKRGLVIARAKEYTDRYDSGELHTVESIPTQQLINEYGEKRVLAALKWEGLRHQGFTMYNRIRLIDHPKFCLDLFFAGREWIFIRENYLTQRQYRSRVYPSKQEAYGAFNDKRRGIHWAEEIALDLPPPSDPESDP